MTPKEKKKIEAYRKKLEDNQRFLDNLQVGDRVIITNTYRVPKYVFGNIIENKPFDPEANILGIGDQTEEICESHKVRGITIDRSFIIGTHIYDREGKPERVHKGYGRTELWEPNPELDELAKRLIFVRTIRDFSFTTWKKFSKETADTLQNIITNEINRINSEI